MHENCTYAPKGFCAAEGCALDATFEGQFSRGDMRTDGTEIPLDPKSAQIMLREAKRVGTGCPKLESILFEYKPIGIAASGQEEPAAIAVEGY